MAYVHRIVKAGACVEHKKMQSLHFHAPHVKRGESRGTTSEKQAKINERRAEEALRWKINANFGYRDLHVVLHYSDKGADFEQLIADRALFLKRLRRECKRRGIEYRYILTTETKRESNPHHHLVINRIDVDLIEAAWASVPKAGGHISFAPLDKRGNHGKLASYLMKESRSMMEKARERGKRGKRFSCSQNLKKPEISYYLVTAKSWRKEPKAKKGAVLFKFDDGSTFRSGFHELSGYPWQEYFEILLT